MQYEKTHRYDRLVGYKTSNVFREEVAFSSLLSGHAMQTAADTRDQVALKTFDEDGIRTHAGRAHWISSPTP